MGPQEHTVERRLVAIFAADVAGYSRLMSLDEVGTLRTLTAYRQIMDRLIADCGGRIANTAGDSVLAEFPSAVDAVQCAVDVQHALAQGNRDLPEGATLRFRIGVHVGDVMVRNGDLLGDGVNIAARLQSLADPGGICLSEAAYGYVRKSVPLTFHDLGEQNVKNMEAIRAFAIGPQNSSLSAQRTVPEPTASRLPERHSIAVLPFTNMSGDPEQETFADGVVDDIITGLSQVKWFFVIARNSSFIYKGRAVDVKQVGRELGVRYVLCFKFPAHVRPRPMRRSGHDLEQILDADCRIMSHDSRHLSVREMAVVTCPVRNGADDIGSLTETTGDFEHCRGFHVHDVPTQTLKTSASLYAIDEDIAR